MIEYNCPNCKQEVELDAFCAYCGFPIQGTEKEQNNFYYRVELKKDILKESTKKVKNVVTMLYIIAGLHIVIGLFYLTDENLFTDSVLNFIAAILFLACSVWVKKQALIGVLAAFALWILLQLSVVLIDPAMIFSGILWKIIIISVFIKGISSARDYIKFKEQLQEMGAIN